MRRLLRQTGIFAFLLVVVATTPALAAPSASTLLVSRPDGVGPVSSGLANHSKTPGALSADGRYAVFLSDANGLAPGANPNVQNLFVRDTSAGTTTLVSRSDGLDGVGANQSSDSPAITVSPAGHVLVAFSTDASNLADHSTGPADPRATAIWLRDVTAGTTTLISRNNGATGAAMREGTNPAVAWSNGGPLVAFHAQGVLYLRTVDADSTAIVSCAGGTCAVPNPAAVTGDQPDMRVVDPKAGTLCAPPAHVVPCVEIAFAAFDLGVDPAHFQIRIGTATAPFASGLKASPFDTFFTVSRSSAGTLGNQSAFSPRLDRNGEAVAWVSSATNLTNDPPAPAGRSEAFLRTLQAGSTTLLSRGSAIGSAPATEGVSDLALGGDLAHLRAAFASDSQNLGGGKGSQAYLRDVATGTTSVLNRASGAAGAAGDGFSLAPALSADGQTAIFVDSSTNLGSGRSDFERVHLRRLDSSQRVELVSSPNGTEELNDDVNHSFVDGPQVVSANGRYVVFSSYSDGLSPDDDNRFENVFVRDVVAGRTTLVSRASGSDGAGADDNSFAAGISADGRRVAFTSQAGNLSPDAPTTGLGQAYVRDLDTNSTTLVSRASGPAGPPAGIRAVAEGISADGGKVLVATGAPLDPAVGASLQTHLFERDLAAQTTTLVDRDTGADGAVAALSTDSAVIDADGGRVAFVNRAPLAGAPANDKNHVYLRDLRTNTTTLVSRADGAAGASADDDSRNPGIDAAGDLVAFASDAGNLGVPGTPQRRIYARDITGVHTELVSLPVDAATPAATPTFADAPSVDAAGDRIAFVAAGLQTPDLPHTEIYVRDRAAQTTTLVSRADGAGGAPADHDVSIPSISPAGDCVAFAATATNLGDGFDGSDFFAVHLRTLDDSCPGTPPAGPGTGGGTGTTGGSTTTTTTTATTTTAPSPALSALSLSPRRFRLGGKRGGTTIRFTLSVAARVTLRIERMSAGHRHGRRCVVGGRGKACTRVASVGSLTVSGRRGRNAVRFSGRLRGHALRPGHYRLTATPPRGKARTVTFTVLAASPRHRTGKR